MLPVNLNDLIPAHIEGLIESEVPESLTLNYKQGLPTGQSESKREFLYDVAAMANSAGGDFRCKAAVGRLVDGEILGWPHRVVQRTLAQVTNYAYHFPHGARAQRSVSDPFAEGILTRKIFSCKRLIDDGHPRMLRVVHACEHAPAQQRYAQHAQISGAHIPLQHLIMLPVKWFLRNADPVCIAIAVDPITLSTNIMVAATYRSGDV